MLTARRQIDIYVARASGRWVVRDADGHFWLLPPTDSPWDDREPFAPDEGRRPGGRPRALPVHAPVAQCVLTQAGRGRRARPLTDGAPARPEPHP